MGSYIIGSGVTLTATFRNSAGALYDPSTVRFVIEDPSRPDGTIVKTVLIYQQATSGWPGIARPSTGVFQLVLPYANLMRAGNWHWRADDGNNVIANESDFQITPSTAL